MTTESMHEHVARRGLLEIYARERRREWIQARGRSMRPLIGPRSWMLVEFGSERPRTGEIVLFHSGEGAVAHRVIGHHSDGTLITKGDGCSTFDPPLRTDHVLGVVRAVRRRAGSRGSAAACTGALALLAAKASAAVGMVSALLRARSGRRPQP